MNLTQKEKIEIIKKINWDYAVEPEEILQVIENKKKQAGPFDRKKLFLRCVERMPWHRISGLWGAENAKEMLTAEILMKVRTTSRRGHLEQLQKILRGEALPPAKWDSEMRARLSNTVLSQRWYRAQQRLL